MSYIRKAHRDLLRQCDQEFNIPQYLIKFKNKVQQTHNLIIKSAGGKCYCTNCNYHFNCYKKTNEYVKCPNCKQKLLIKTDRLHYYDFEDILQVLERLSETDVYVIRTFELHSSYDGTKVTHRCTEYMRSLIIDDEIYDFVSNIVSNHMGYMYVGHWREHEFWRKRNTRWAWRNVYGLVCPYNLKKLFKGTPYQYCQLDKFVKHTGYIDIHHYLKHIPYHPQFEYLVKLKLWRLCEDIQKFDASGRSFEEVLGVDKTFYPFIKKYNLSYDELKTLRVAKTCDIGLIKRLTGFYYLEELSLYVDLKEAYKRVLRFEKNSEHTYLDYLRFAMQLGFNMKDKKVLYPTNLRQEHDKLYKQIEMIKDERNDRLIKERAKELEKYIYKDKQYIIFPMRNIEDFRRESEMMNNCTRTYATKVACKETSIFVMRKLSDIEQSLVTVEVKNNLVVQSEMKNHRPLGESESKFLQKWQRQVLQKV